MFSQGAGQATAGSPAASSALRPRRRQIAPGPRGAPLTQIRNRWDPLEGGSLRETAANGRFRTLGNGVRDGILAPWHIRAGL
jgi:hypothetical protein